MRRTIAVVFIWLTVAIGAAPAQTTEFTYQGRLSDGGSPPNAAYDMQFKLFNAVSGGSQVGLTVTKPAVQTTNGTFNVPLDFTSTPFSGQTLFLEMGVRQTGNSGPYTVLAPRQRIGSSPYSIQSLNATTATFASTAINALELDGVPANQFVITNDARLSDARAPLAGYSSYIQNSSSPQSSSNFNVTGIGTANIFNATTQYNIGGIRVLSAPGNVNTFLGINAGRSNNGGQLNSFFGNSAGDANTTGSSNSFFGVGAGFKNTTGSGNSFFGASAGDANTAGGANSFFGTQAGEDNTTGSANSFFGNNAGFSNTIGNGNSFFGREAGKLNTSGVNNSFFGDRAGLANTTGNFNSFYGEQAGLNNTTGFDNTFVGRAAGISNTTGFSNSFFGKDNGIANTTGGANSFFGMEAGKANTTGSSNAFFGYGTGDANTTGRLNSFFGAFAGSGNTAGRHNVLIGANAGGQYLTVGSDNTFVGYNARLNGPITSAQGSNNTLIGSNTTASNGVQNSTAIGAGAHVGLSNTIILGTVNEDVDIPGRLNVYGTKNFKIDHPLDPHNKFLYHAAIESSEVLNIYSGNVTTDENGDAVVTLPKWFGSINRDFRYQLTVVGTFAQAIIAGEISDNRFTIKTNAPNVKVSWQVTGIRSDEFMRMNPFVVEDNKPENARVQRKIKSN